MTGQKLAISDHNKIFYLQRLNVGLSEVLEARLQGGAVRVR